VEVGRTQWDRAKAALLLLVVKVSSRWMGGVYPLLTYSRVPGTEM
jgi:hypothetical protein